MARKKAIDLDTYSALDAYCIGLNEFYKALRRSGFSVDLALGILVEPSAYPDWIIPNLPNRIDNIPYDDEDDED